MNYRWLSAVAFVAVALAIGLAIVAYVGEFRRRRMHLLLAAAGFLFAGGLVLITFLGVLTPSLQSEPSISASFEMKPGIGLVLDATVKAQDLPAKTVGKLEVDGLRPEGFTQRGSRKVRKFGVDFLYRSTLGPGSDGVIDETLQVPVPAEWDPEVAVRLEFPSRGHHPFPLCLPGHIQEGCTIIEVPSPAAPPGTPAYVALGDSFSSGEGVPPFDLLDAGNGPVGEPGFFCDRSESAYARVFAREKHLDLVGLFACSGATTANFYERQSKRKNWTEPQLDRLGRTTTLVTLTIGGNDAGFAWTLTVCFATPHCQTLFPLKRRRIRNLRSLLLDVYIDIHGRAPHATIVVVGYPEIFSGRFGCRSPFGFTERRWFNSLTVLMDQTIQGAVDAARLRGIDVYYLSTLNAFAGHELCSKGVSYVNGHVKRPYTRYSYHPNELGQKCLADVLEAEYPTFVHSSVSRACPSSGTS